MKIIKKIYIKKALDKHNITVWLVSTAPLVKLFKI